MKIQITGLPRTWNVLAMTIESSFYTEKDLIATKSKKFLFLRDCRYEKDFSEFDSLIAEYHVCHP